MPDDPPPRRPNPPPENQDATVRGYFEGEELFGRYKLKRFISRGGMGMVWLARDQSLETDVALKFLPELVVVDAAAVADLKRETRRARELSHPGVVKIFDFVQDARTAAITMEFIDGPTLSALRLQQPHGVFAPEALAAWVEQLGSALDYAHAEAKVVHRDLKPSNLLVTSAGKIKIADFGIAATLSETATRVSRVASSSGSPPYMSPQQLMGKHATPADDVYALGATLYELLTGKPPFYKGDIFGQVLNVPATPLAERRAELLAGEESGSKRPPAIPEHWEKTIQACLAKEPAQRPATAGEIARRLRGDSTSTKAHSGASTAKTPPPLAPADISSSSPRTAPGAWKPLAAGLLLGGLVALTTAYYFMIVLPARKADETKPEEKAAPDSPPASGGESKTQRPNAFPEAGRPHENSLGMKFTPLPGTATTVLFSIWETREVDYGTFAQATGRSWPNVKSGAAHPATNVSWEDARAFCTWLTRMEQASGKIGPDQQYRLPTDHEWSLAVGLDEDPEATPAAKSGKIKNHYPWGSGWPPPKEAGNYSPSLQVDDFEGTSPAGGFDANRHGLHDLGGNVWEWVEDTWDPKKSDQRVLRGASFGGVEAVALASSFRGIAVPGFRDQRNGFRVVLALNAETSR